MKAVFLDRDGTLIEDVGFLNDPRDIIFFGGVFSALLLLQKYYQLFIVTNQTGVAKGYLSLQEVVAVNKAVEDRFSKEGIVITETYVCPHSAEDNCLCRKPKPHFLLQAAGKYNIDLSKSFMIGDHPGDIYCAENAGSTGIYLFTGHGLKHLHEFDKKPICRPGILDAAKYIMSLNQSSRKTDN
jgi:D-glycero-D-manno-heptose 1,7-bisphosphate phosphatase